MTAGRRASCLIMAGPNGAGKTTIYRRVFASSSLINADIVASSINPLRPEAASLAAGRVVVRQLAEAILSRSDFAYETTLASHHSLQVLKSAAEAGFHVTLAFVILKHADLHIQRVAQRVALGGHHIDAATIRRRFEISLDNLPRAAVFCDDVFIFDNSAPEGADLVFHKGDGVVKICSLDTGNPLHRRLSGVLS